MEMAKEANKPRNHENQGVRMLRRSQESATNSQVKRPKPGRQEAESQETIETESPTTKTKTNIRNKIENHKI